MRRRDFLHTSLAAGATAAAAFTAGPAVARLGVDRGAPAALDPGRWSPADPDRPLRLSSNENPLGPSAAARQAILDGLGEANRYTHGLAMALRSRVAAHHGVDEASVVLGNGSTEVLRMAVQAMAGPAGWGPAGSGPAGSGLAGLGAAGSGAAGSDPAGSGLAPARIVVAEPTFEHVEAYAAPWGLEALKVPLRGDHAHDIGRMRDAARAARGSGGQGPGRPVLAFVCNPNNPTGTLTPCDEVESWIREADDVVFLVDEAYFEYVDDASYRSMLPLALERPNVVVVRTFSKIHGLAGLRIGYALAHPDAARRIRAFSGLSNLNALGLLAATASLGDDTHVARSLRVNDDARRVTYQVLDELGLERLPSQANFVLHQVRGDQAAYIRRMREHGIQVGRPFPPLLGYNRLSLGTPEEMGRFAGVLREFRRRGWT
jgi:histidinol-phosphate aminotransferase